MIHYAKANRRRGEREVVLPEGFQLWCRIEELSEACGFDPVRRFDALRELPEMYPPLRGQDPEEIAEEHPVRALAALVARFLREYPEAAAAMARRKPVPSAA
ncbi:MAG: hypothetical protein IJQ71_00065 [Clostridia bacterium]|nr:hypothetical protein [Clostridia bacterium]MBR0265811.1 hypothetical protein [Clostridia bacterium]